MEHATTDITAMISAAIQEKQAQTVLSFNVVEQSPPDKVLTWNVTHEQIARINAGDREALDKFYFENYIRIVYSARRFMRHNVYLKAVINHEDLIQQVYCDLRTGLLKLRPFDEAISRAMFHSFRYSAVGGIDEIYIMESKQCRKQPN